MTTTDTTYICPSGQCTITNQTTPTYPDHYCTCTCGQNTIDLTNRDTRLLAPTRATHEEWTARDETAILPEGVLAITFNRLFTNSAEYFIGDGIHKYSELKKYAGAPASHTSAGNTLVLRCPRGYIDRESLPHANESQYGTVKASTTPTPEATLLADENGKFNIGNNATISPETITTGTFPQGVTIDGTSVLGDITGNAPTATRALTAARAEEANHADSADRANTADTAAKVSHTFTVNGTAFDGTSDKTVTFNADGATAAACTGNSASATRLATARNITVTLTLNGHTLTGTAAFDGNANITINLGTLTKEQLGYTTSTDTDDKDPDAEGEGSGDFGG